MYAYLHTQTITQLEGCTIGRINPSSLHKRVLKHLAEQIARGEVPEFPLAKLCTEASVAPSTAEKYARVVVQMDARLYIEKFSIRLKPYETITEGGIESARKGGK